MYFAGKRIPSDRLLHRLTTTGLMTRADIQSVEPLVRQLAMGLPDFDSVWLDALVQHRFLTPWQSDRLAEESWTELTLGRYRLQEPLGSGSWLGVESRNGQRVVIRRFQTAMASTEELLRARLLEIEKLIAHHRRSAPSELCLPSDYIVKAASDAYLISPFIPGWSLRELLVRGGRLPWQMVAEIGHALLSALAWSETTGLIHGNITMDHVVLDPQGHVHLVDGKWTPGANPGVRLGSELTLHQCEGLAPELFGTGRGSDIRSELYSLGTVLWQALTSRPVVLNCDPVTRMMKLREQDVVDVRNWVPDCPDWMARIIHSMTRRSPELRPTAAAELLKIWGTHSGTAISHSRRIVRQMPEKQPVEAKRPVSRQTGPLRWIAVTTSLLLLSTGIAAWRGLVPLPLSTSVWSGPDAALAVSDQPGDIRSARESEVQALPVPDDQGVVHLKGGIRYEARRLDYRGTLRIQCADPTVATVQVREGSQWILNASVVELSGLRIQTTGSTVSAATSNAQQMLAVQSETLNLQRCLIESPSDRDSFVGLGWYRLPGSHGTVIVMDSVFSGGGYGMSLNHPPQRFELSNVLLANRGSGVLCEFAKNDPAEWTLACRHVTQRFGFSVADTILHTEGPERIRLRLRSRDSVYSPEMSILRIRPPASWTTSQMEVHFESEEHGNPAVVPIHVEPVVYIDRKLGRAVALPKSAVPETTLLFADLVFSAPTASREGRNSAHLATPDWMASILEDFDGPKLTPELPGILNSGLPR